MVEQGEMRRDLISLRREMRPPQTIEPGKVSWAKQRRDDDRRPGHRCCGAFAHNQAAPITLAIMLRTSTLAFSHAASNAVPLILRYTNRVSIGGMYQMSPSTAISIPCSRKTKVAQRI